jgi:hypothetical protein
LIGRVWVLLVIGATLVVAIGPVRAQDRPADEAETQLERLIETDRNSFTFTPLTADPGRLITEFSYTYIDVRVAEPKHSFPEFIGRYGLNRRVELRFGWNYETGGSEDPSVGDIANFFGADMELQAMYGAKYSLTYQKGPRPASAAFVQGHTPTGGAQTDTQVRAGYVFGWELKNEWIFDAGFEWGTDTIENDDYIIWAPSAVLKVPLGRERRWFTNLEYFSVISSGKAEGFSNHFLDTGLHFLITPDIEIGGLVGLGLNREAPPLLATFGIGFRF